MPFQAHGEMYHLQEPLASGPHNDARYLQLYIYDPEYAANLRCTTNSDLNRDIIENLTREINECNPHIALYKSVHELLENNQESSVVISPSLNLRLIEGNDRSTENLPTSNEITMIIPTSADANTDVRDVRIYFREDQSSSSSTPQHNQSKIRADLYNGLEDALINQDTDAGSIGTRLILPSSFVGGPRFMAKQYQDAMAILIQDGKKLPPRCLLAKQLLIDQIWFARDEFDTAEKLDNVISVCILSKENDAELHEIITKNMMHGPCGTIDTNSPCMIKDINGEWVCSKRFSKQFTEEKTISEDGYPLCKITRTIDQASRHYIRHPSQRKQQFEMTNEWVVPYNPYLSKKVQGPY
ncbi:hypothetical protein G6F56_009386 [Rhizopus delemar]|nr:hypothetical protein G6F56_009386 [Rhizopus delemar]